jgi:hypothetical protein
MYAGKQINIKSKESTAIQSDGSMNVACKKDLTLFASKQIGIKSKGALALKGTTGTFDGGSTLSLKGGTLNLNGGSAGDITTPKGITKTKMPSATFNNSTGWTVSATGLESIVTRAPTHEPWPYHNQGVAASVSLQNGQTTASPNSPDVDDGWSITKE